MVSLEAIQSYILRIRMPRPGQVGPTSCVSLNKNCQCGCVSSFLSSICSGCYYSFRKSLEPEMSIKNIPSTIPSLSYTLPFVQATILILR